MNVIPAALATRSLNMARVGDDTIYGGGGIDKIVSGNNNDTLYGQTG